MNFMNSLSLFLTCLLCCCYFATANANTHLTDENLTIIPQTSVTGIALTAGGASAAPGQEFCVNITAADFDSVVAMQYSMTWDTSVIQFLSYSIIDMPDPSNFGGNALAQGVLAVSWNASQDTIGGNTPWESIPDGTVLYEICFTAVGEVDECSNLSFTGSPLPIEVVTENSNQANVGINNTDGQICIIEPIALTSNEITNVNCANAGQGSINLEFTGGTLPYTYEWSGPNSFTANTEDLNNLENGTYYLTLTDASMFTLTVLDTFEVIGDFAISIADAGADTSLNCYNNGLVTLNGTMDPDNSDITIEWFTNDGDINGSTFTQSIEVEGAGTYFFVTTNLFSECSDTAQVIVLDESAPPVANAGMTNDLNCLQSMINLNAGNSTQGNDIQYVWTTIDGNILMGDSTQTPLIDMPGLYTLTVFDESTGCSNTSSVTITQDSALPTAIAGQDTTLTCEILTITLDGTGSSVGNDFTYLWYTTDGGAILNPTTLMPTIEDPGTYFLVVTDNANLCSDTSMLFVSESILPPATDAGASITISCSNFAALLDGTNSAQGPNYEYLWTSLDGNIVEGHTTLTPLIDDCGTYTLQVTNTDDACTNMDTVLVLCDTIAPIADLGILPSITCAEPIATINGSNSSTGSEYTYLWNSPFGNITGGQGTQMITVDEPGVYGLLVEDTSNGCVALTTGFVGIDTIAPIANAGEPLTIECGDPISLSAIGSSIGDTINYFWSTINGNILEGETTLMPMVDVAGEYIVAVTNTLNGCVALDTVLVDGAAPLASAVAEADSGICGSETEVIGNLPFGATGMWSSTNPNDFFENPMMDTTVVMDLDPGFHTLIWTLSTIDCPDYDMDSITIFIEGNPDAVQDLYELSGYQTSHVVTVLENDDTTQVQNFNISIVTAQDDLDIDILTGGDLEINYAEGFFGYADFTYALCNAACPDLCDTTLVQLNISEPLDTITIIPNGITPNGDGINDEFIFPDLSMNPELYPDNEFVVFNRWGNIVYRAQPYNNDWSGQNNGGKDLPQGTYYYVLRLNIGAGKVYEGDVTILR